MRLVQREVPNKNTRGGNAFTDLVSPEMFSQLKRSPGVMFQICDDDGHPLVISDARFKTIQHSCKKPYRLISRAAGKTSQRHVWISNDPAYWEKLRASKVGKK